MSPQSPAAARVCSLLAATLACDVGADESDAWAVCACVTGLLTGSNRATLACDVGADLAARVCVRDRSSTVLLGPATSPYSSGGLVLCVSDTPGGVASNASLPQSEDLAPRCEIFGLTDWLKLT